MSDQPLVQHEPSPETTSSPPRKLKCEQILQGALTVFLEHGYAGTSMDRVAAVAGVSKQTIYSHFQDKQGLFTALIERMMIDRFRVEFGSEPLQGEPAMLLRRLAETFLTKMGDAEFIAFFRLVIAESARFPELAQLYTRTVMQYGYVNLSQYFESHPELHIADPEAMSRIFFGSLGAFILVQEVMHGKQIMAMSEERLIDSLIATVLSQATVGQVGKSH